MPAENPLMSTGIPEASPPGEFRTLVSEAKCGQIHLNGENLA
ncbi:hypothetical protein ASZ90_015416 [hydrocarbon metagenome]|uniref:Uncharacterized protein n=1 Tax=hydrocarbon metagenome TaxID=938273 RepID=A0A0W8F213_9ZZZZ